MGYCLYANGWNCREPIDFCFQWSWRKSPAQTESKRINIYLTLKNCLSTRSLLRTHHPSKRIKTFLFLLSLCGWATDEQRWRDYLTSITMKINVEIEILFYRPRFCGRDNDNVSGDTSSLTFACAWMDAADCFSSACGFSIINQLHSVSM